MELVCIELRVDELLQQAGITWAELARRTGMSKSVLSGIKNGQKRTLNHDHELKLANEFGVEIQELYKEKIEKEYLKPRLWR